MCWSHLWRFGDPPEGVIVAEDVAETGSQGYGCLYQLIRHSVENIYFKLFMQCNAYHGEYVSIGDHISQASCEGAEGT